MARELPEKLEIDFLICDNTLNRKGWRLLVEGIDTTGFLKNPVCCVQHDTWSMPVGKWKNLKVENSTFTGTVEFDKNDDEAIKFYWKYADGYMNAVSLNILPLSEDTADVVAGQSRATVSKSELLEISLVTVPGQKNAVKLSTPDGEDYQLSIVNNSQNQNPKKMEKDPEKEALQLQLDQQKKLNAANLVKLHVQRGVVQEGEIESLNKLAAADYETVEKMLEARTPAIKEPEQKKTTTDEGKKLADKVAEITQDAEKSTAKKSERDDWSFMDWFKKDAEGLSIMQEKEPEKYKKLESDFALSASKQGLKA